VTSSPIGAVDGAAIRKARGAFFTPAELCRYVTDWAIRSGDDDVLEPSCGEAAFLLAAGERLDTLAQATGAIRGRLDGVELHARSAREAERLVRAAGHDVQVQVSDFFLVNPAGTYDAVVGNPPYVRYQDFSGAARARSRKAALYAGVPLNGLASSWAAFTVHAALFLKTGGRLGLVLPAELLTVNYAAEVRRFLMERFARVRLVLFTELVFPGVLEEVVLLLADGYDQGPVDHCELHQVRTVADLSVRLGVPRLWKPETTNGKWTPSLMPANALAAYLAVEAAGDFTTLHGWGETTLGMVTGNNRYFAMSPARAAELGLRSSELLEISPPGSRHLRELTFTASMYNTLGASGFATMLFRPTDERRMSAAASAYIEAGERLEVDAAYKCRVRSPWWRVPLVKPADLLLTYMNADAPQLCTNRKAAHYLNSVHGVFLRPGVRQLGMDLLPLASLNSMTLLGAETVGRAYGGGMLKLEPKEADRLPVPSAPTLVAARSALAKIRPRVLAWLRQPGGLREAAKLVDDVLLIGELGMSRADVTALREAHTELTDRRTTRGRSRPRSLCRRRRQTLSRRTTKYSLMRPSRIHGCRLRVTRRSIHPIMNCSVSC
jgi:adenine-specific DNA-methyltransferase